MSTIQHVGTQIEKGHFAYLNCFSLHSTIDKIAA